jgi:hypothetical protein
LEREFKDWVKEKERGSPVRDFDVVEKELKEARDKQSEIDRQHRDLSEKLRELKDSKVRAARSEHLVVTI